MGTSEEGTDIHTQNSTKAQSCRADAGRKALEYSGKLPRRQRTCAEMQLCATDGGLAEFRENRKIFPWPLNSHFQGAPGRVSS